MSAVGDQTHDCDGAGCACGGIDGVKRLDLREVVLPPAVGAALFAMVMLGAIAIARWLTP